MQFLNPIWLWSALGILVPIAIHLWNQQPGKVLEVGSIRFMDPSPSKRSSRLQLTDIWLLLLRCFIILLLALFMAKPIWNTKTNQTNQGWVLMPRGSMSIAYHAHSHSIDSLLQLGMELHAMEPGFPLLELGKDTLIDKPTNPVPNIWALASQLEQQAPIHYQLHLFTPEQLLFYRGLKPKLQRAMFWKTYPMPSGLASPNTQPKQTIRVAIFAKDYAADAEYLMAAFKAIQTFSGDTILLTKLTNAASIPQGQDWLFWLSDQAVPKNNAKQVWSYQLASPQQVQTQLYAANWANQEAIPIYQYSATSFKGISIWEDGFGQAVLEKRGTGQYFMHTRFHPDWNGLVWSPAFPAIMMPFLLGSKSFDPSQLAIDPSQILPDQTAALKEISNSRLLANQPAMSPLIWTLLLMMLLFERGFVFYQSKNKAHV